MEITFGQKLQGNLDRGGQEIRVDLTRRMLRDRGHAVEVLTPLSREIGDLVHFFGADVEFAPTANLVRTLGVPYVVSTIWNMGESPFRLLLRRVGDRAVGRDPYEVRAFLRGAKRIVALTEIERDRLVAYYGLGPARISIVPNGVADRFFDADPEPFRARFGIRDEFVLNCARICPRKNQLTMVRALKGTGKRMVFIGQRNLNREYARQCAVEAGDQGTFLDPLENDDPLLASAYAAATVFCLPSEIEVLSVAALEAAGAGLPLVLSDSWGSREHFGDFARYVNYRSERGIREAVLAQWKAPAGKAAQQAHYRAHYSWSAIVDRLETIYREALAVG